MMKYVAAVHATPMIAVTRRLTRPSSLRRAMDNRNPTVPAIIDHSTIRGRLRSAALNPSPTVAVPPARTMDAHATIALFENTMTNEHTK